MHIRNKMKNPSHWGMLLEMGNTAFQNVLMFLIFWTVTSVVVMATDPCFDVFSAVQNGMYMEHHTYSKTNSNSLYVCAAQCLMSAVCLSFSYDRRGQICHLNDNTAVTNIVPRADFIYSDISAWPKSLSGPCSVTSCPGDSRCDVDRLHRAVCITEFQGCGEPQQVPESERTYDGHFLSAIAHYTMPCSSDSIDCNRTSECQSTGQWENVPPLCEQFRWNNPVSDTNMYVPCGPRDRLKVTIVGTASSLEERTTIKLNSGTDILFVIDFRFNYGGNSDITIINTQLDGVWGHEISIPELPLVSEQQYNIQVTLQNGVYTVTVADAVFYSFEERKTGVQPEYFSISQRGPVTLVEISVSY